MHAVRKVVQTDVHSLRVHVPVTPSTPADASLLRARNATRCASGVTGCRSATSRSPGVLFAACRTRLGAACDRLIRSCARPLLWRPAFPSAPGLGSIGSAEIRVPWFANFPATTPGSDFCRSYVIGVGSLLSLAAPSNPPGQSGDLPGPDVVLACMRWVSDAAEPLFASPKTPQGCCLRPNSEPRHSGVRLLDAQSPRLHAPRPTLRLTPRGCPTHGSRQRWGLASPLTGLAPATRSPVSLAHEFEP